MARKREQISGSKVAPGDKRARKRITIYLHEDGSPDLDALPEDQRAALGIGGDGEPEPENVEIDPSMVGLALTTLIRIEAMLTARRFGVDQETAVRCLTPPPPVRAGIEQAGARVLTKYAGAAGKYQDEIVLATLLITWQTSAIAELRERAAIEVKAEPEPEPKRGPVPVPERENAPEPEPGAAPAIDLTPFEAMD